MAGTGIKVHSSISKQQQKKTTLHKLGYGESSNTEFDFGDLSIQNCEKLVSANWETHILDRVRLQQKKKI